MAVTLPSDLIMDVMRNVDSARRSAAVARLRGSETEFADTFAGLGGPVKQGTMAGIGIEPGSALRERMGTEGRKADAHIGFERLLLRNLFESILPSENSGTFGSEPSAGVWRSMAADQLAGVYAESGGIGVADILSSSAEAARPRRDLQWPYFELQPIKAFAG